MNNKRDIFILDCPEIKCQDVMIYVFDELCGYYKRNNYNVEIITNYKKIIENSIVFMSNDFRCSNPQELLFNHQPNAIYIAWYWNEQDKNLLKYFINIYENFFNIKYNISRYPELKKIRETKYNCPLLLRANEDPNIIGTLERKEKLHYCYMGSPYHTYLKPSNNYKGIFHATYNHKEFINYENRKKIYLSSIFALGIQSTDNIGYMHTSQRIYEGLAYGCIVLTNSQVAVEQCDNIPILINSREDIENKMKYYINNPDKLKEKQLKGYNFIKINGTNENAINIINKILDKF